MRLARACPTTFSSPSDSRSTQTRKLTPVTTTSPVDTNTNNALDHVSAFRRRQALAEARPQIEQVDKDSLFTINVDIPDAVRLVLGNLPEILPLRAEIVKQLPEFPIQALDTLETVALAAAQAHQDFVVATTPPEPIQALYDELLPMRDVFISDVRALKKRDLIDDAPLASLRGPPGFKNMVDDVFMLTNHLRTHWAQIAGKTGTELAELDKAEDVAERLDRAVAIKEQGSKAAPEAKLLRQRAFTLFVKNYNEVRRAVAYLRPAEGAAEAMAPSVFIGRNAGAKVEKAAPPPAVTPPVATPPVAAPAGSPAAPSAPAPVIAPPPGMPGTSPFTR